MAAWVHVGSVTWKVPGVPGSPSLAIRTQRRTDLSGKGYVPSWEPFGPDGVTEIQKIES